MMLWLIFWADFRYDLELFHLGIYPKNWMGLKGVVFSPVIHGSLQHLTSNTIPVLVLGASLYYFYP
ncbi:MAG: rhomboid family intramembrane serine protease, partial [Owenweeksia sp.]